MHSKTDVSSIRSLKGFKKLVHRSPEVQKSNLLVVKNFRNLDQLLIIVDTAKTTSPLLLIAPNGRIDFQIHFRDAREANIVEQSLTQ